jgi:VWFA-related protein
VRTRLVGLACAAAALAVVIPALAQYRGALDVDAVVAPVTVRTGSGRVVADVAPGRFHLFIDGLEFPIQDLAREDDLPLSLGFVLDTSGSMGGSKFTACQQLMLAFIERRRPDDQLALWTFGGGRVLERFPFGTGWFLLPRILESVKPWSTTALYDMVQRFRDVMERAIHPRRVVILLTDGVDNASEISYEEATRIAQSLNTPVYVLGVEPPPRAEGEQGPSFEEILELIADSSGGHYQRIPDTARMPEVVQSLLSELSSRYLLTFETSGIGLRKWRHLEVRVDGHEATTRSGYVGTLP